MVKGRAVLDARAQTKRLRKKIWAKSRPGNSSAVYKRPVSITGKPDGEMQLRLTIIVFFRQFCPPNVL